MMLASNSTNTAGPSRFSMGRLLASTSSRPPSGNGGGSSIDRPPLITLYRHELFWEFEYCEKRFMELCERYFDNLALNNPHDTRKFNECHVCDLNLDRRLVLKNSFWSLMASPFLTHKKIKRDKVEDIFNDAAKVLKHTRITMQWNTNHEIEGDNLAKKMEQKSLEELQKEIFLFLVEINEYLSKNLLPAYIIWVNAAGIFAFYSNTVELITAILVTDKKENSIINASIKMFASYIIIYTAILFKVAQDQVNIITELKEQVFPKSLWIKGIGLRLRIMKLASEIKPEERQTTSLSEHAYFFEIA